MSNSLKTVDKFFIIAKTCSSSSLIVAEFGLKVTPISTRVACELTKINKIRFQIFWWKLKLKKKRFQGAQQTTNSSDNFNKKVVQDKVIDIKDYESSRYFFTEYNW